MWHQLKLRARAQKRRQNTQGALGESVLEKIQTDRAAHQHVEGECTPPFLALMEPSGK